jgi:hypothetical protein
MVTMAERVRSTLNPALTSSPIKEANVAQTNLTPNPFPAQGRAQLTITAGEISKYPKIGAFASQSDSCGVRCERVAAVGQARTCCVWRGDDQKESMGFLGWT